MSVGSTEVAVDAGGTSTRVTLPADPRALLRRRAVGDRPILNAVGRILDDVLPAGSGPRGSAGRAGGSQSARPATSAGR